MTISSDTTTIGWDIGGANVKAARLSWRQSPGTVSECQTLQQPFAIWQERDRLATLLAEMAAQLGPADCAAITITAELSDAFRTKREGIAFVLDAVQTAMPGVRLSLFGVDGRFHPLETGYKEPLRVAAANWMATALLAARCAPDAILVDVGSTTTDIIPLIGGRVAATGKSDPARLLHGELLYTGALRTTVPAIVRRVPLWGGWCSVSAEHFATAQDVHLLLGHLPADTSLSPTADGRPADPPFARERLARVVCADMEMLTEEEIQEIAHYIAREQIYQIAEAIIAQIRDYEGLCGALIAAGVGAFLVEAAAKQLELPCRHLSDLMAAVGPFDGGVNVAAPAAAAAILVREWGECMSV